MIYFSYCCKVERRPHFSAVAILTTVIFQQIAHKPTKFKKEFAAYIGEMYPVRLCLHVLPDASLHVCRWFLVGPVSECLGAFGFYLNVTKQAGFRSRKLWNRRAY